MDMGGTEACDFGQKPSCATGSEGDYAARCGKQSPIASSSGRLRVLLIGHQFQVPSEGQAKAAALSRYADLDVHVLAPERYREAEVRWRHPVVPHGANYAYNVTPVRLAWGGPAKWYLQSYPGLKNVLLNLRPDVIDIWEEPWSLLSAQICFLRDRCLPHSKLVSETEQNISKSLPPPFEWLRSFTLKKADFLVARNLQALEVARFKGFRGLGRVVGNGVDVELFRAMDRAECKRRLGMEGFVVGYVGRLVAEKGLESLLEAFHGMRGERCLWLCGDGPLRERLLREPFVRWAGALPREHLPQFYNALDALVLPSLTTRRWKEQFGRVLVEAQACGTPVLGSDSGAIPEVIGDAGLVFPEANPSAIASAINQLQGNVDLQRRLSCAGRERVHRLYRWEAIAQQMREIYLSLMSESKNAQY